MFSQSCFFHEFLYINFLFLSPMCTLNPPPSLVISFLEICPESRKFSVPLPVPHLVQAMTISGLDCCIIVLMIFFFSISPTDPFSVLLCSSVCLEWLVSMVCTTTLACWLVFTVFSQWGTTSWRSVGVNMGKITRVFLFCTVCFGTINLAAALSFKEYIVTSMYAVLIRSSHPWALTVLILPLKL